MLVLLLMKMLLVNRWFSGAVSFLYLREHRTRKMLLVCRGEDVHCHITAMTIVTDCALEMWLDYTASLKGL